MKNYKKILEKNSLDPKLLDYLEKCHVKNIDSAIDRLISGEPIQYIVGNVDFYGRIFKVTKDVLIPRFETELLVEKTIKLIKEKFNKEIDIIDIGTGSGCIAITLNKELNTNVDAIDISEKALEIAKYNNKANNANVNLFISDIFSNVSKKYDVIISNPPYISIDEKIMDVVKNNEPHLALYAKDNGLYFYNEILRECRKYLNDKYLIAFEIGMTQSTSIVDIAKKELKDVNIIVDKDYSNNDRYIFITNIED